MLLVEPLKWWCEHINKLVEREAFIDFVKVYGDELKGEFLYEVLSCCNQNVVTRMIWKVEMACNWFRIIIESLNASRSGYLHSLFFHQ